METQVQWKSGASYGAAPSDAARVARDRFEKQLAQGRQSANDTINYVVSHVPEDAIVASNDMEFKAFDEDIVLRFGDGYGTARKIHKHAMGQLASRANVPLKFVNELLEGGVGWKHELLAHNLNELYHREPKQYLARSVNGELRGWLSDRYARYDSRPVLERFIDGLQGIGALPLAGTATDTRWSLKAVLPTIYEPVPGEVLVYGLELLNSDFGNGALHVRAFIDRLWCWNLCSGEDAVRKTHLGAKLGDDIRYSEKTYALQTETQASAVEDVVKHLLAPEACETMNATIQKAASDNVKWETVKGRLKNLTKGEVEKVKTSFEGPDTYNLPEGQSTWRLSNAVSWLATSLEDGERKLDLEREAGRLISA